MSLLTKPPYSPTPEQLAEALDLLREAQRLDQLATDAMLKAEAAFRKIGRPLPLFDRLKDDGEGR